WASESRKPAANTTCTPRRRMTTPSSLKRGRSTGARTAISEGGRYDTMTATADAIESRPATTRASRQPRRSAIGGSNSEPSQPPGSAMERPPRWTGGRKNRTWARERRIDSRRNGASGATASADNALSAKAAVTSASAAQREVRSAGLSAEPGRLERGVDLGREESDQPLIADEDHGQRHDAHLDQLLASFRRAAEVLLRVGNALSR